MYFESKGIATFYFGKNGIEVAFKDKEKDELADFLRSQLPLEITEDAIKTELDNKYKYELYDLMDGKEFIEDIKNKCLMDYDGFVVNVFVNGYESNLGLHHSTLNIDGFKVTLEKFEEMCNTYDIKVNWANK